MSDEIVARRREGKKGSKERSEQAWNRGRPFLAAALCGPQGGAESTSACCCGLSLGRPRCCLGPRIPPRLSSLVHGHAFLVTSSRSPPGPLSPPASGTVLSPPGLSRSELRASAQVANVAAGAGRPRPGGSGYRPGCSPPSTHQASR